MNAIIPFASGRDRLRRKLVTPLTGAIALRGTHSSALGRRDLSFRVNAITRITRATTRSGPRRDYSFHVRRRPTRDERNGDEAQRGEAVVAADTEAGALGRGRHQFCLQRRAGRDAGALGERQQAGLISAGGAVARPTRDLASRSGRAPAGPCFIAARRHSCKRGEIDRGGSFRASRSSFHGHRNACYQALARDRGRRLTPSGSQRRTAAGGRVGGLYPACSRMAMARRRRLRRSSGDGQQARFSAWPRWGQGPPRRARRARASTAALAIARMPGRSPRCRPRG
jgi:hypothetical protein